MEFDRAALDEVRKSRLLISQLDEWLGGLIKPYLGSRVIEIGCGHGNILRHLTDRELVVGVDVDQRSVDFVNSEFRSTGCVRARVCDVTSPSSWNSLSIALIPRSH